MGRAFKIILLFIVMVGLQALVFSRIQFRGVINAFPYIYFIIILPFGLSGRVVLLLSALLGFGVDFLSGTFGVHMTATVFAGYLRLLILPALSAQDGYEQHLIPSIRHNGRVWFLRYSAVIVLAHHTALFFVESFTFVNFGMTLVNMLASALFSIVLILIFQLAIRKDWG